MWHSVSDSSDGAGTWLGDYGHALVVTRSICDAHRISSTICHEHPHHSISGAQRISITIRVEHSNDAAAARPRARAQR